MHLESRSNLQTHVQSHIHMLPFYVPQKVIMKKKTGKNSSMGFTFFYLLLSTSENICISSQISYSLNNEKSAHKYKLKQDENPWE